MRAAPLLVALGWSRAGRAEAPVVPPSPVSAPTPLLTDLGLPPARKVTLAEALAYAREHQPAVLAALAQIRTERANAQVPRAQYLPLVGVTAQFVEGTVNNTTPSYLTDPFVDLPRIGGTPARTQSDAGWRPYASTLAAAGLSQEIFDFGRIAAQAAAADARVTVATHAADTQRLDIELNVEEAFFAVHAAQGILQAAEGAYQRSLVHRDFAGAGVKSGLRSPIDLTRAEADLTRFDTARIRARGGRLGLPGGVGRGGRRARSEAGRVRRGAVGQRATGLTGSHPASIPAGSPVAGGAEQVAAAGAGDARGGGLGAARPSALGDHLGARGRRASQQRRRPAQWKRLSA